MRYIIIDSGNGGVSVYGPFHSPELARIWAQENNINGVLDVLIHPHTVD